jgi:putative SOS response-associated peptidase YedK
MCGRVYQTYSDEELYFRYLSTRPEIPLDWSPAYNLCPTQDSPIVRIAFGNLQIDRMRWQLVPGTEPAFSTKLSTINARSEGVFSRPLYRDLVIRQRCIVPVSGFYEWKRAGALRRPFRIHLRDEAIMSIAGVWDTWHPDSPDQRHSFSILTTSANEFMKDIHNRMPVILDRSHEAAWLDPTVHERAVLEKMLRPCPASWLDAVEVSTLVNSPKNNTPEVLRPRTGPFTDDLPPRLFDLYE